MNKLLLTILFYFFSITAFSQQRDLNYYIEQAQKTSPLIQKNKNDNKSNTLLLR